ncbi:MAG: hypothetical protein Q9225_005908 [Loekoesia sp. 1 TL-2023]
MFKGRSKGLGSGRGAAGQIQKVPLKGLFSNGVWHFYTCQQAQPKRCDFFLWDDDAKPREAAAVLSNSRTEPVQPPPPPPQTPVKPSRTPNSFGLQTPYTDTAKSHQSPEFSTPKTPSKLFITSRNAGDTQNTSTTLSASDEEFYDWPASDDEDVFKAAEEASSITDMPPPETPRKAAKTEMFASPGKRRFSQVDDGNAASWPSRSTTGEDVFVTPNTGVKRDGFLTPGQNLSSPADTPTPRRSKDVLQAGHDSELTTEVLSVLQKSKVFINPDVRTELKAVCEKHALSTRGILKGRDISRAMVNTKNEKISELQGTIAALQAERETNRAVIRHLRRDMETAKNYVTE